MIKLGMMARQTQDATIESIIDFAYELKLDVIELHLAGIPSDRDYLRRIKLLCLKRGLPIGYLGAGSLAGPPEEFPQRIEQGKGRCRAGSLYGSANDPRLRKAQVARYH